MAEDELVDLDTNELKELHRLNKSLITSLEDDIRLSKQRLKAFGPEAELLEEVKLIRRPDGTTDIEEIKNRLHNDIRAMEGRMNETVKLTGVSVMQVVEHTEMTDDGLHRVMEISLEVLGRTLILKCEIDTQMSDAEDGKVRNQVSWMEVQLERDINDVIGDAVAKSTEEVAFHPVMCQFKSYLQCVIDRDRLITHFTRTYPNLVHHWIQEQTHKLKITTGNPKHPTFILEWDVKISETSFRYTNDVTLQVEASEEIKTLDSKGVMDAASEMFALMTAQFGLEKAIDNFVQLLAASSVDDMNPAAGVLDMDSMDSSV